MHRKNKTISMIASLYRLYYTVEQLERINTVTGQAFPISGDLWLTEPQRTNTSLHYKIKQNENYGRNAPERLR